GETRLERFALMKTLQSTIYVLFLCLTSGIVVAADGDILPTVQTDENGDWEPYGTIHPLRPPPSNVIAPPSTINNAPAEEEIGQQHEQAIEQQNEENGTKHNNA